MLNLWVCCNNKGWYNVSILKIMRCHINLNGGLVLLRKEQPYYALYYIPAACFELQNFLWEIIYHEEESNYKCILSTFICNILCLAICLFYLFRTQESKQWKICQIWSSTLQEIIEWHSIRSLHNWNEWFKHKKQFSSKRYIILYLKFMLVIRNILVFLYMHIINFSHR